MREKYLIETPHKAEECLTALDEIVAYRPDFLKSVYLGCNSGTHIGWATIDAESESDALRNIPTNLRGKARAVKVGQFTPEQIKSFHEM